MPLLCRMSRFLQVKGNLHNTCLANRDGYLWSVARIQFFTPSVISFFLWQSNDPSMVTSMHHYFDVYCLKTDSLPDYIIYYTEWHYDIYDLQREPFSISFWKRLYIFFNSAKFLQAFHRKTSIHTYIWLKYTNKH